MHFGQLRNPAAIGRKTGGASYGSAVAVASKEVSFALGVDTVGNCRVPAAYCGLYGFRPTANKVRRRYPSPTSTEPERGTPPCERGK